MQNQYYIGGGNPCNPEGTYKNNALNRRLNRVGKLYKHAKSCSYKGKYLHGYRTGDPYSGAHHHGKRSYIKKQKNVPTSVPINIEPVITTIIPTPLSPVREIDTDIAKLYGICKKLLKGTINPAEANINLNLIIRKYGLDTSKLISSTSRSSIINNCANLHDQLRIRREISI